MTYTTADLDTLARTVFGEARGEPPEGQYAVAHVVLNRVKRAPRYGGYTITEVCRKPFQFSCWLPDDPNYPLLLAANIQQPTFLRAFGVACMVVSGAVGDPTGGATHYFVRQPPPGSKEWPPAWSKAMMRTVDIGAHSFFKEG